MSDSRFSLDMIEVRTPCSVPWDSMRGGDHVRHCGQCKQNVYQLSTLSKDEAEDLIRQREGKLCVRFYRRPDGSVVTRDCAAVRWSRAVWNAGAFVAFGICTVFAAIGAPEVWAKFEKWRDSRSNRMVMGDFCPPPGTITRPSEIAPPPREVKPPESKP